MSLIFYMWGSPQFLPVMVAVYIVLADINIIRSAIVGKNDWLFYNANGDSIANFQRTEEYSNAQFE